METLKGLVEVLEGGYDIVHEDDKAADEGSKASSTSPLSAKQAANRRRASEEIWDTVNAASAPAHQEKSKTQDGRETKSWDEERASEEIVNNLLEMATAHSSGSMETGHEALPANFDCCLERNNNNVDSGVGQTTDFKETLDTLSVRRTPSFEHEEADAKIKNTNTAADTTAKKASQVHPTSLGTSSPPDPSARPQTLTRSIPIIAEMRSDADSYLAGLLAVTRLAQGILSETSAQKLGFRKSETSKKVACEEFLSSSPQSPPDTLTREEIAEIVRDEAAAKVWTPSSKTTASRSDESDKVGLVLRALRSATAGPTIDTTTPEGYGTSQATALLEKGEPQDTWAGPVSAPPEGDVPTSEGSEEEEALARRKMEIFEQAARLTEKVVFDEDFNKDISCYLKESAFADAATCLSRIVFPGKTAKERLSERDMEPRSTSPVLGEPALAREDKTKTVTLQEHDKQREGIDDYQYVSPIGPLRPGWYEKREVIHGRIVHLIKPPPRARRRKMHLADIEDTHYGDMSSRPRKMRDGRISWDLLEAEGDERAERLTMRVPGGSRDSEALSEGLVHFQERTVDQALRRRMQRGLLAKGKSVTKHQLFYSASEWEKDFLREGRLGRKRERLKSSSELLSNQYYDRKTDQLRSFPKTVADRHHDQKKEQLQARSEVSRNLHQALKKGQSDSVLFHSKRRTVKGVKSDSTVDYKYKERKPRTSFGELERDTGQFRSLSEVFAKRYADGKKGRLRSQVRQEGLEQDRNYFSPYRSATPRAEEEGVISGDGAERTLSFRQSQVFETPEDESLQTPKDRPRRHTSLAEGLLRDLAARIDETEKEKRLLEKAELLDQERGSEESKSFEDNSLSGQHDLFDSVEDSPVVEKPLSEESPHRQLQDHVEGESELADVLSADRIAREKGIHWKKIVKLRGRERDESSKGAEASESLPKEEFLEWKETGEHVLLQLDEEEAISMYRQLKSLMFQDLDQTSTTRRCVERNVPSLVSISVHEPQEKQEEEGDKRRWAKKSNLRKIARVFQERTLVRADSRKLRKSRVAELSFSGFDTWDQLTTKTVTQGREYLSGEEVTQPAESRADEWETLEDGLRQEHEMPKEEGGAEIESREDKEEILKHYQSQELHMWMEERGAEVELLADKREAFDYDSRGELEMGKIETCAKVEPFTDKGGKLEDDQWQRVEKSEEERDAMTEQERAAELLPRTDEGEMFEIGQNQELQMGEVEKAVEAPFSVHATASERAVTARLSFGGETELHYDDIQMLNFYERLRHSLGGEEKEEKWKTDSVEANNFERMFSEYVDVESGKTMFEILVEKARMSINRRERLQASVSLLTEAVQELAPATVRPHGLLVDTSKEQEREGLSRRPDSDEARLSGKGTLEECFVVLPPLPPRKSVPPTAAEERRRTGVTPKNLRALARHVRIMRMAHIDRGLYKAKGGAYLRKMEFPYYYMKGERVPVESSEELEITESLSKSYFSHSSDSCSCSDTSEESSASDSSEETSSDFQSNREEEDHGAGNEKRNQSMTGSFERTGSHGSAPGCPPRSHGDMDENSSIGINLSALSWSLSAEGSTGHELLLNDNSSSKACKLPPATEGTRTRRVQPPWAMGPSPGSLTASVYPGEEVVTNTPLETPEQSPHEDHFCKLPVVFSPEAQSQETKRQTTFSDLIAFNQIPSRQYHESRTGRPPTAEHYESASEDFFAPVCPKNTPEYGSCASFSEEEPVRCVSAPEMVLSTSSQSHESLSSGGQNRNRQKQGSSFNENRSSTPAFPIPRVVSNGSFFGFKKRASWAEKVPLPRPSKKQLLDQHNVLLTPTLRPTVLQRSISDTRMRIKIPGKDKQTSDKSTTCSTASNLKSEPARKHQRSCSVVGKTSTIRRLDSRSSSCSQQSPVYKDQRQSSQRYTAQYHHFLPCSSRATTSRLAAMAEDRGLQGEKDKGPGRPTGRRPISRNTSSCRRVLGKSATGDPKKVRPLWRY